MKTINQIVNESKIDCGICRKVTDELFKYTDISSIFYLCPKCHKEYEAHAEERARREARQMRYEMRYRVFGDSEVAFYQQYTYIQIDHTEVPRSQLWNYIDEVLRERFSEYNIDINHAGKTIRIDN